MQNKTLKHLITWLVIANPLWWTSGCYTVSNVEKLDKSGRFELVVSTKGKSRYDFRTWSVDSIGSIKGAGTRSVYDTFRGERRFDQGTFSIPRDSISSIGEKHFDVGLTLLAVVGGAATVALFAYGIARSAASAISFGGEWGSFGSPAL
jgi:hypothetical protein